MSESLEALKEDFLKHHGVKGQKWGVTRPDGSRLDLSKKDFKWANKAARKYPMDAYNRAADKMNKGEIDRINNKPEYKGVDMNKNKKVATKYYKEYSDTMTKHLNDAVNDLGLKSPNGALKIEFEYDVETDTMPRFGVVES